MSEIGTPASGVTSPHGEATGTTPGQAADAAPEIYYRWLCLDQPGNWTPSRSMVDELWHEKSPETQEFWRSLDAAQQPQPAPELAADEVRTELAARITSAIDEAVKCRKPVADCRFCASNARAVMELADAYAAARTAELADRRAEVINDILGRFSASGSGHTARVGMVQIAKWRTQAELT